jgi:hypothetical protein
MAFFTVRSYVSIEITVEAEDRDEAINLASEQIAFDLQRSEDFEYCGETEVYDEEGNEVEEQEYDEEE